MVPFLLKVMRFDIEYCDRVLSVQRDEAKRNGVILLIT